LYKIINKILIRTKTARQRILAKRALKNPLFYFGLLACFLLGVIYVSCSNPYYIDGFGGSHIVFNPFFDQANNVSAASLFSSQANAISLETPDFKIAQNNTLCGVSTPCVISGKVLGDAFGASNQKQKNVVDYTVQAGDTFQSIANAYKISVNTLLWANDLTSSSIIKVGQSLAVLPTDGVLHIVKSGDTISGIAQTYKAQSSDIVAFNGLSSQDDIYIGDILIIPGGTMPKKTSSGSSTVGGSKIPLASNYFIFPAEGRVTQGLHYYNAVDVANSCGTSIYAAASGVVQRAVYNNAWNLGMGNYVTILHPNGTVTYYGHFQTVFVKPGDKVNTGDRIGLMGQTGNATGCHVHFQVMGASNPLSKYLVGSKISYK